jgi:hypothetical protein
MIEVSEVPADWIQHSYLVDHPVLDLVVDRFRVGSEELLLNDFKVESLIVLGGAESFPSDLTLIRSGARLPFSCCARECSYNVM